MHAVFFHRLAFRSPPVYYVSLLISTQSDQRPARISHINHLAACARVPAVDGRSPTQFCDAAGGAQSTTGNTLVRIFAHKRAHIDMGAIAVRARVRLIRVCVCVFVYMFRTCGSELPCAFGVINSRRSRSSAKVDSMLSCCIGCACSAFVPRTEHTITFCKCFAASHVQRCCACFANVRCVRCARHRKV